MKELDLIRGRFNQTFKLEHVFGTSATHRAWHGPSLMRALEGLDADQAKAKPIGGLHSIWEIVKHCAYWMVETAGGGGVPRGMAGRSEEAGGDP